MKKMSNEQFMKNKIYQKFFTTTCSCGHVIKFEFMEKEKLCYCCGKKLLSKREWFKLKVREAIERLKIQEELEKGF